MKLNEKERLILKDAMNTEIEVITDLIDKATRNNETDCIHSLIMHKSLRKDLWTKLDKEQ